jgi:hypothetical protein
MTSTLPSLLCLGAPAPELSARIPFDGGTFLALYGHRAYAWLCRLWHTGCAHGSVLCELLGYEVGDSALGLLLRAEWIERGALEPTQGARARASFAGQPTATGFATPHDYAYTPVRSSALRAVVVGCIPAPPDKAVAGYGRMWLPVTQHCYRKAPLPWPEPECSHRPIFEHEYLTWKLRCLADEAARREAYLALPPCAAVHPSAWAFPCVVHGEHVRHLAVGPYGRSVIWEDAKPAKAPKPRKPRK